MKKFTKPTGGDMIRSIVYLTIYVAVIGAGAVLLLPRYWYLWMVLVLVGMVLLVNWHRGATLYQCLYCDHVYQISFLTDLFAPHGVGREGPWLLLRCPNCKKRSKTRVLKRVE
jgi:hypothetical protein